MRLTGNHQRHAFTAGTRCSAPIRRARTAAAPRRTDHGSVLTKSQRDIFSPSVCRNLFPHWRTQPHARLPVREHRQEVSESVTWRSRRWHAAWWSDDRQSVPLSSGPSAMTCLPRPAYLNVSQSYRPISSRRRCERRHHIVNDDPRKVARCSTKWIPRPALRRPGFRASVFHLEFDNQIGALALRAAFHVAKWTASPAAVEAGVSMISPQPVRRFGKEHADLYARTAARRGIEEGALAGRTPHICTDHLVRTGLVFTPRICAEVRPHRHFGVGCVRRRCNTRSATCRVPSGIHGRGQVRTCRCASSPAEQRFDEEYSRVRPDGIDPAPLAIIRRPAARVLTP